MSTAGNENARSVQYATFLDLDLDVKTWLQIPASDTTKDGLLQIVTDAACWWVQDKFFSGPVGPTTYKRAFDGWTGFMGAYIMLPYTPVLEINEIIEYRGASGAFPLTEMPPDENTYDGFQCVYQEGRINRVFPGNIQRPFFGGSRNIWITWTAGYNPIPANIKMGTLNLIAHWFRHAQQQGALTLASSPEANHEDPIWGGVPEFVISQLGGSSNRISMG